MHRSISSVEGRVIERQFDLFQGHEHETIPACQAAKERINSFEEGSESLFTVNQSGQFEVAKCLTLGLVTHSARFDDVWGTPDNCGICTGNRRAHAMRQRVVAEAVLHCYLLALVVR